jgi:hypothetical protein
MPKHTTNPMTAAPTKHDALPFECVIFPDLVRHKLNRLNSLPPTPTPPEKNPNSQQIRPVPTQIPDSRVADHSSLRPIHPAIAYNPIRTNHLLLYPHKHQIFGPVRPCASSGSLTPRLPDSQTPRLPDSRTPSLLDPHYKTMTTPSFLLNPATPWGYPYLSLGQREVPPWM